MSDYGFMEEWKDHVLSKEAYNEMYVEGYDDKYEDYLKRIEYCYHSQELIAILNKVVDAFQRDFVFYNPEPYLDEFGVYVAFVEDDEEALNVPSRNIDKFLYFNQGKSPNVTHYEYVQDAIDFFIDDIRVDTIDLGLFDDKGDWNFYLSEDEMTYLGFEDEIERQREDLEVEEVLE